MNIKGEHMNIGICDDNKIYQDMLYKMVTPIVSKFSDVKLHNLMPNDLKINIQNRTFSYDILITDIEMGELNGIELVGEINNINPSCIIIFISNFINYATKVYDVSHIYSVLKDEAEERLPKALDKAIRLYKDKRLTYLAICYQNVNYLIPHADITYIESIGRYLYVHTEKQVYKSIKTLTSVYEELGDHFVRSHKSFIINLNYIALVTRCNCTLKTKENIPISNTFSRSFLSTYRRYASNKLD